MRKFWWLALLCLAVAQAARAQPLEPMAEGSFDGTSLPRAMSALEVLGSWELPKGGWIKISVTGGGWRDGCKMRNTDPDSCRQARFYLSATHERPITKGMITDFGPTDYFLFRGPNGTGWRMPTNETLKILSDDKFSIRLCGYQAPPPPHWDKIYKTMVGSSMDEMSVYRLDIARRMSLGRHFVFRAALKNLGYDRPTGCSPFLIEPPSLPQPKKH